MIQLHRLEGFYWVARSGGYAKAARAFPYPITQPAIHSQVKKLEQELGLSLFERVAKDKMRPTPAGERLYRFVQPFFEGLPPLLRHLSEGDYSGELRIRAAGLHLRTTLPRWIQRLHKKRPQIHVHLEEHHEPDLRGLRRGDADLLVDYLEETPDDIATLQVGTLHAFLALPRAHPEAKRAKPRFDKLAGETFIGYTEGRAHDLQFRALAEHGVVPARTLSASSVDVILSFVEAGLGYSLVPWPDPAGPKRKGVLSVPLKGAGMKFPIVAAWRKDTPENALLDAALECAPKV